MTPKNVKAFIETLETANPDPKSDLNFSNPFELTVAVLLSAQATDASVNKATVSLFEAASTPEQMVALGIDGIGEHIKTLNYWPTKAKHVFALSRMLIDKHGSRVPDDRKSLEALPGVGPKTAGVILNHAFDRPEIPVDTHVFRVSNRTGLATGKTPAAVEKALLAVVPKKYASRMNNWLVLHGRYICKARKPLCENCPLTKYCEYFLQGRTD